MKRFLTAIVFCVLLLTFGLFLFSPNSDAQGDVLERMLKLPAPPPPNPDFRPYPNERSEDFYSQKNPPPDDASLEDLMDYWQRQSAIDRTRGASIKPSDKTLERIKAAVEEDPEKLTQYLNLFAENADGVEFVKRVYDSEMVNRKFGREWREAVKGWLTYNSSYFSDELLQTARTVRDENDYVTNQDELLALAIVDWNKALPILEKLLNDDNQPVSQALARWAFYQHALDTNNQSEIEKYRKQLQKTVEDKSAKPGTRDLAFDALVRGGDYEGRDEWYLTLLEDETLHNLVVNGQTYTGLTTLLMHSPTDKYDNRMAELLGSDSKAVRSAAIRNLAFSGGIKKPEVVKLLLPWLEDANWANDVNGSRRQLISALKEIYMPESVPGLLAVLNERELPKTNPNSNTSRVVPNSNSYVPISPDTYNRMYAVSETIQALGNQRDVRAIPAIRQVINELETWQRQYAVEALLKCGGFTPSEQVEAVEFTARHNYQREEEIRKQDAIANKAVNVVVEDSEISMPASNVLSANMASNAIVVRPPTSAEEIKTYLGIAMMQIEDPSAELVSALLNRIETLEKSEPAIARAMRDVMRDWKGVAVNALLLRSLRDNKADIPDILKLLARRKELREKQLDDIYDARGGHPRAAGLAACLLEQNAEYDAILQGENVETKIAMLACARLIRAQIPPSKVAPFLRDANKMLVSSAEKYLESEDSPEARAFVLGLYPNQAKVLGARNYFGQSQGYDPTIAELFMTIGENSPSTPAYPYAEYDQLDKVEKNLQKEVVESAELLGIYAYDQQFIRIYKDKAVFSWEENDARFRERSLEENEFERFKGFLTERKVDQLPPFLSYCYEGCEDPKELLMIGKNGGRRVYYFGVVEAPFFKDLEKLFEDLRRPPAKLQYYLQKNIPGLEVLFENKDLLIETVWKNGADLRVLVNNEPRREQIEKELTQLDENDQDNEKLGYEEYEKRSRKRREMREYENYGWFNFTGGQLGVGTSQPAGFSFIPKRDQTTIQPTREQWKTRAGTTEIRAGEGGLFKVSRNQLIKISDGYFDGPIISANGRWAIARKFGDEEGQYYGPYTFRINLLTGKAFRVPFDRYPPIQPIVFVASQNKFLVGTSYYYEEESEYYEYEEDRAPQYQQFYWLDAETGALTPAKKAVMPLAHQTYRALQPVAGKPDEFWTALRDDEKNLTEIGAFNARTLTFKAVKTLPQIKFESMQMWIDETESKAYIAFDGHLLSVPLK